MDNKDINFELPKEKTEQTINTNNVQVNPVPLNNMAEVISTENQVQISNVANVQNEVIQSVPQPEQQPVPVTTTVQSQVPENQVIAQVNDTPQEKKIKNETFNSDERVIYEIKQDVEGNPLVVVAFIVILIGFVFLLPTISEKTGLLKNQNVPIASNPATQDPVEEKPLYNGFHDEDTINGLRVINLVTSYINGEYKVNFTLINESKEVYTFDEKYYLVLYDEEKLVYRALIHSYEPIAPTSAVELSLVINERAYNNANKYDLEEIITGRYPAVNLQSREDNYDTLTCTYLNNTVTYYFEDEMLIKIKDEIVGDFESDTNYEATKQKYRDLSIAYNSVNGFSSVFVENLSDFRLLNDIDLKTIQNKELADLKIYKYFKFREDVRVVSFEMSSQGYTCG